MHTVDLLDRALRTVETLGYQVRQDWLDGAEAACEIKGQKWLFLDLASSPLDKLHVVAEVLSRRVGRAPRRHRPVLRRFIETRHAA